MSAANSCDCNCPTPEIVTVPGSPGSDGVGTPGTDGLSSFTLLTADAVFADTVATVQATVASNQMFVVGQTVFGGDPSPGTDHGTFEVMSLTGTTLLGLRATAAPGDTTLPFTLETGGKITATGATGALSGALPTALTDNTTGTASNTLAAGVGVFNLVAPLSSLATGLSTGALDLLTNYTVGFRFQILAIDWVTTIAGTGAGASQVFNLEINATNVTGGVATVTLASTATVGSITAGTAITAANVGTATDTISLEMAASGTAFTAGAGYFLIRIRNLDTSDAVASLADHINDLITALT